MEASDFLAVVPFDVFLLILISMYAFYRLAITYGLVFENDQYKRESVVVRTCVYISLMFPAAICLLALIRFVAGILWLIWFLMLWPLKYITNGEKAIQTVKKLGANATKITINATGVIH